MNETRVLRLLSFIEGLSLVSLLFIGMPLKYGLGMPLAVRILGMVHGVLFLALLAFAMRVWIEASLPRRLIASVVGLSFLPFGWILADRRFQLLRKGGLDVGGEPNP